MQAEDPHALPKPSTTACWTAVGAQGLALFVLVFGDIGFDKPGRWGLDYGHALLLVGLWIVACILGLVTAIRMRRTSLVILQLVACAMPIANVLACTH